ncbi:hypothetical protein [Alteribacter keqinensis]|uniref:Uncharacterized protein n=1 Tax=Alteribacter keqinensis TaxID=2483800 RepID=A0A3M7TXT5_9BACI|nr:hypothetical protein [Alteribacter keqinensis]RNA70396.1 hypothetical protein EBO34_10870 [Alteribacter keqinensis]
MTQSETITKLRKMLIHMKNREHTSDNDFKKMQTYVKELREEEVNENFEGSIVEMDAFIDERTNSSTLKEHIKLHEMNIARWIEELEMLKDGDGGVTIDYEQRESREI